MEVRKVGILGCGTMGAGIAQVVATAGYPAVVREPEEALLERGLARIRRGLERARERGKLDEESESRAWDRVVGVTDLEPMRDCDLILETLPEDLPLKKDYFQRLDLLCPPSTIFASNTSSLVITALAACSQRPGQVIGLHFFNPAPVMELVEIVSTYLTSPEVLTTAQGFVRSLGKTSILAPDRCGFVVNRLLVPYLLDAVRSFEHGLASIEDIDKGMRLGCGHPMGPLALSDLVGLDTLLSIAEVMYGEFREPRFAPPPLLRRMVWAGWLGKKSGRGFYDYQGDEPKAVLLSRGGGG